MKAQEFDKKFDEGKEDIIDDLDLASARRVNQKQKRINVDFPSWVVESLDREAARIGVTRQSIIKVWLVERLKAEAAAKPLNGDAASGARQRITHSMAKQPYLDYASRMSTSNFEWNEAKNLENQEKHGVCFEEAQHAFLDQNREKAQPQKDF